MATQLTQISENNLISVPNLNLANSFSQFNSDHTWNYVSGSGTAKNLLNQQQFEGIGCLRIVPNGACVVNTGGSQMQMTIQEDGNYIVSFKFKYSNNVYNSQTFFLKVYKNATLVDDYFYEYGGQNQTDYITLFLNLNELLDGDVLDFAFEFGALAYGGAFKTYFDGFKLEKDNFGFGIPSIFSEPLQSVIDATETIDIPSIGNNETHRVDVTISGAEVGDFVSMTYPPTILDDMLLVGFPVVSATNTVSFLVHNHSGGSVDTASGDFSFKITK